MLKSTEKTLPENSSNGKSKSNHAELATRIPVGFFSKVISTLKTSKMDFSICESLFNYRLNFILEKNKKRKNERKSNIFDSNYDIDEDIESIIAKIFKILEVDDGQILILSLFLIEKFMYRTKIILDEVNIIKIVVVSLLETIKYNIDEPNINAYLICLALKIDKNALINMEMLFLNAIDYKLKVDQDKFSTYKQKIMVPWINYLKENL
jgi:hypothetical protein